MILHMNKLLSIQDRVGAWGQSFVPPSPSYREHCWSRADSELCVIPPTFVWKDIKTFLFTGQNIFM